MATDEFRAAVKAGKSNLEALREVAIPEFFEVFKNKAKAGVEKMFNLMADGGVGLAYGHSPVIEAAAEVFGHSVEGGQLLEKILPPDKTPLLVVGHNHQNFTERIKAGERQILRVENCVSSNPSRADEGASFVEIKLADLAKNPDEPEKAVGFKKIAEMEK